VDSVDLFLDSTRLHGGWIIMCTIALLLLPSVPLADNVYVVARDGITCFSPIAGTIPIPSSMTISVASLVCQLNVLSCPSLRASGRAVNLITVAVVGCRLCGRRGIGCWGRRRWRTFGKMPNNQKR